MELEAVGLQFEPYQWLPCGVTWDSSQTVVVIKLQLTSALCSLEQLNKSAKEGSEWLCVLNWTEQDFPPESATGAARHKCLSSLQRQPSMAEWYSRKTKNHAQMAREQHGTSPTT